MPGAVVGHHQLARAVAPPRSSNVTGSAAWRSALLARLRMARASWRESPTVRAAADPAESTRTSPALAQARLASSRTRSSRSTASAARRSAPDSERARNSRSSTSCLQVARCRRGGRGAARLVVDLRPGAARRDLEVPTGSASADRAARARRRRRTALAFGGLLDPRRASRSWCGRGGRSRRPMRGLGHPTVQLVPADAGHLRPDRLHRAQHPTGQPPDQERRAAAVTDRDRDHQRGRRGCARSRCTSSRFLRDHEGAADRPRRRTAGQNAEPLAVQRDAGDGRDPLSRSPAGRAAGSRPGGPLRSALAATHARRPAPMQLREGVLGVALDRAAALRRRRAATSRLDVVGALDAGTRRCRG